MALILIGGVAFMASDGDDDGTKEQVATAGSKGKEATPAKAETPPQPADAKAVDPAPTPTPTPTPPPPQPDSVDPTAAVEPPPNPTPVPEPEVVVDDPPQDPVTAPNQGTKKNKRNKRTNKKEAGDGSSSPPPPKPPPPSVDPAALISEARKVGLTNPRKGYELARQAQKAGGGRQASKLMATMACRIPDAGKAKRALSRLKGADREAVAKICRAKGIDV